MRTHLWQPGQSGNPAGRARGSRNALSEEVICALLRDFRKHGEKAIARVRRLQPAAYLKILALLVPKEMKLEHTGGVKAMTDEQLIAGIEALERYLAAKAAALEPGENAKIVEGVAQPIEALPAPDVVPDAPNKVMDAADTADKRKLGKGRVPSPAGT
jgi:hypothetical protein